MLIHSLQQCVFIINERVTGVACQRSAGHRTAMKLPEPVGMESGGRGCNCCLAITVSVSYA